MAEGRQAGSEKARESPARPRSRAFLRSAAFYAARVRCLYARSAMVRFPDKAAARSVQAVVFAALRAARVLRVRQELVSSAVVEMWARHDGDA